MWYPHYASVRPHPKLWLRKASFCGRPKQSDYTMRVSRTAAPTITLVILHTALLLHAESRMHRARADGTPSPGRRHEHVRDANACVGCCMPEAHRPPTLLSRKHMGTTRVHICPLFRTHTGTLTHPRSEFRSLRQSARPQLFVGNIQRPGTQLQERKRLFNFELRAPSFLSWSSS